MTGEIILWITITKKPYVPSENSNQQEINFLTYFWFPVGNLQKMRQSKRNYCTKLSENIESKEHQEEPWDWVCSL